MKNKEKYANEIIELAINGGNGKIAVDKRTGEPVSCIGFDCNNCLLFGDCEEYTINSDGLRKWADAEYKEPLSAKTVADEFRKFCHDKDCEDCEYSSTRFVMDCKIRFVIDNYNVTEKEAENG